ncbi:MAG: hypothetical protein ACD_37C00283G0004 [uncultured bacterium]|nr:MAG: hypothetical protein ACD_37C00283G0004 [uncultured bacterium]
MKKYKSVYYAIYDNLKNIGSFKQYLIDNSEVIVCFHFPHGYSKTPSYMEIYQNGRMKRTNKFPMYKGKSNIVKLLVYYIYFYYILIRFVPRKSFVVVDTPIFCILSRVPSFIKKVRFIYWIGDFYPSNKGFMRIYNSLANYYNKSLGIVWYVSPPLKKVYSSTSSLDYGKIRMLVPLGTKRKKYKITTTPHSPIRLGFVGVIREQQGLDLIFNYLQKFNNAILDIVGDGYKLKQYKDLAKEMNLKNKVKFYGYVDDMDRIAEKWDIGIALYENDTMNVSIYCEPTKIKNYLEFNLPVITTKTTYFHKELEKEQAGVAIDETIDDLGRAIDEIKSNYLKYKEGVSVILNRYEYHKFYNSLLKFMEQ